jgi:hypothetical protein
MSSFFPPINHAVGVADVVPELEVPQGITKAQPPEWRHHAAHGFAIQLEIDEYAVILVSGYRCLDFGRHRLGYHAVNGADVFGEGHGKVRLVAELRMAVTLPDVAGRHPKGRAFRHVRAD